VRGEVSDVESYERAIAACDVANCWETALQVRTTIPCIAVYYILLKYNDEANAHTLIARDSRRSDCVHKHTSAAPQAAALQAAALLMHVCQ
jgi:hypothetical protein